MDTCTSKSDLNWLCYYYSILSCCKLDLFIKSKSNLLSSCYICTNLIYAHGIIRTNRTLSYVTIRALQQYPDKFSCETFYILAASMIKFTCTKPIDRMRRIENVLYYSIIYLTINQIGPPLFGYSWDSSTWTARNARK